MPVLYPLDTSGVAASNLVTNELHTVNEAHFRDYYFIVPTHAPFYIYNFSASITVGGVTTPLVEDVDYSFTLSYVTGTRTTGKQMYGGITLHNLDETGMITLNYQTIGGDQVPDRMYILAELADKVYNPATTIWDILTNVPNAFPPVPHYQDYDQFFGQEEVVAKLEEIADAIATNSSLTTAKLQEFMDIIGQTTIGSGGGGGGLDPIQFLLRAGGTMEGPLTLNLPVTGNNHAINKGYVDSENLQDRNRLGVLEGHLPVGLSAGEKLASVAWVTQEIANATPNLPSDLVTETQMNQAISTAISNIVIPPSGATIEQVKELISEAMMYMHHFRTK